MVRFGGYYSLSSLLFFVAQNADKILLALCLGSTRPGQVALGMYSQAFNLMMKPVSLVTTPVTSIMLPALARVAHHRQDFSDFVSRFYRLVGIVLLPAGIGLVVVANDLMLVLGGARWAPAGYLLTVLAPTILVQGFLSIAGSVFAASGQAGRLCLGSLATAAVLSSSCVAGFWIGGIWFEAPWGPTMGVACSYSLATVGLLFGPYMLYCFRSTGVRLGHVFLPLVRAAVSAALMGIAVAGLRAALLHVGVPGLPRLIASVLLGTLLYGALAGRELRWLVNQLRDTRSVGR
jgi:PST family polysaccharide transporter